MTRDHYRVLGVKPNASHEDVRSAYLRLVKQHHPDVNKSCGDSSHFKAIASAWEVLGDKTKRAYYDQTAAESFRRPLRPHRPMPRRGAGARGWTSGSTTGMPPILQMFEAATHPRILMWVVPIGIVGFFVFSGGEEKEHKGIRKVRAWHNPVTNRWETPAPWDPAFRKHEHLVQKVDRNVVHQTERRP